ncbi:hypothetical protein [Parvimonas parva]|uniref:hypothetical protein n=1 Tax=Parvimonas parva TaxID=2769485 RepID=UPI0038B25FA0
MKGKNFKLKVLAIASACLIVVGFTGSYYMLAEIQSGIDREVMKNTTYKIKEILKTEKEIKYIDLSKYRGHKVEIKKSKDNFNRITVTYKDKYFDNEAKIDEKNENKVDIITRRMPFEERDRFDIVKREVENAVIYNRINHYFGRESVNEDNTKIVLEVKNPIELMRTFNYSKDDVDKTLLKNELTFSAYDRHLFNTREFENSLNRFEEFTIKDVNYEKIEIPNTTIKKLNYIADEIEKLTIEGNNSIYREDNRTNVNVDVKKVKDFVELDLRTLTTDININGAKKVVIAGRSESIEFVVKYKDKDGEKTFIINRSENRNYRNKDKEVVRKVINIDSEKIFRTLMDSDSIKGNLQRVTDLKEVK